MTSKGRNMLVLALIVSNIVWLVFYLATRFDHGITLTYQQESLRESSAKLDQALMRANRKLIGKSLEVVKAELTNDKSGHQSFVKEQCLYANGLCLAFDDNEIVVSVRRE